MKKEDAIKYLQQLYPNGGHCWLDEQRIEAIGMAIKALQKEPASEDLYTVAKEYANNITEKIGYRLQLRRAVCFGANWQLNQIRKENEKNRD